jgi:hypothetical protein
MSILKVAKLYNLKIAQVQSANYQTLYYLYNDVQSFYKKFPKNIQVQFLYSKIQKLMEDVSNSQVDSASFSSRVFEIKTAFDAAYKSSEKESQKDENKLFEWGNDIVGIESKLQKLEGLASAGVAEGGTQTKPETKMWKGKAPLPAKPAAGATRSLQAAYDTAYRQWAEEWKEEIEQKDAREIVNYIKELQKFDSKTSNAFRYWLSYFYPTVAENLTYKEPAAQKGSAQGAGVPTDQDAQWQKEWQNIIADKNPETIYNYIKKLQREGSSNKLNSFYQLIEKDQGLKSMVIFYARQKQRVNRGSGSALVATPKPAPASASKAPAKKGDFSP